MSNRSLEYQAKFRAETSELQRAQGELKKTGQEMRGLGMAAGGFVTMSSGLRDALRGNAQGLVTMAMGAGMAWRAISNLHPVLKLISVAMAAAAIAQSIFSARQKQATEEAERLNATLKSLGLSVSEVERHQRVFSGYAKDIKEFRDAADSATDSMQRFLSALKSVRDARLQVSLSGIDLDEAEELAQPGLTSGGRSAIQSRHARRRLDARLEAERDQHRIDSEMISQERGRRESELSSLDEEGRMLQKDVAGSATAFRRAVETPSVMGALPPELKNLVNEMAGRKDGDRQLAERGGMILEGAARGGLSPDQLGPLSDAFKGFRGAVDRQADFGRALPGRRDALLERGIELEAMQTASDQRLRASEQGIMAQRDMIDISDRDREVESRRNARRAVSRYRFDQLEDEERLGIVEGAMERTRRRMGSAGISPEDRDRAATQLVEQARERDSIQGRLQASAERQAADEARAAERREGIEDQVSRHQESIEEIGSRRTVQDVGLLDMFRHMYDVQGGRNPDEIAAEAAKQTADHMRAVRELLEELKR